MSNVYFSRGQQEIWAYNGSVTEELLPKINSDPTGVVSNLVSLEDDGLAITIAGSDGTGLYTWTGSALDFFGNYINGVSDLTNYGDELYFISGGVLYTSTGSQAARLAGSARTPVANFTESNGKLYYVSDDQVYTLVGDTYAQITNFTGVIQVVLAPGQGNGVGIITTNLGAATTSTTWEFDDDSGSVTSVGAVNVDGYGINLGNVINIGGTVFFSASSYYVTTQQQGVFAWSGSSVSEVYEASTLYLSQLDDFTDVDGNLYFVAATDNEHDIVEINTNGGMGYSETTVATSVYAGYLTSEDGSLYFTASDDGVATLYKLMGDDTLQLVAANVGAGVAASDAPFQPMAPTDFAGDGLSDILWRDVDGGVAVWNTAAGSSDYTSNSLGNVSTDWQIAGVGDFNGAGADGLLWRDANGDVTTWNASLSSPESFGGNGGQTVNVSADWQIAGVGDFNGDGLSDVLWRDANGDVDVWYANAGSSPVSFSATPTTFVSSDWQIAGIGDFNGSGSDGILWRDSNGDVTTWNSSASAPGSFGGNGGTTYYVGNDWQVAGVGDFNGDGQSDIVWRDTNGDVDIWLANSGSSPVSFDVLPPQYVSTDWQIASVGDYNGDGKADIAWRNTNTGDVTLWESTAGASISFTSVDLGHVSADWQIAAK